MLPIVPSSEARFWRIYRCLLLPVGTLGTVMGLLGAIATAFGESTPIIDGRPIHGVEGVLLCLVAAPFIGLFLTFCTTVALWIDRRKMRSRS